MYGVTLWLPSVIRALSGLGNLMIGAVAAIPYMLTAVAMVVVGRHSDHSDERRWHSALSGVVGAVALGLAAYARIPWLVIVGMSVGMMGAQAMVGPFWAMASTGMAGSTAAATIAVINSIGNVGGYFGPSIIGLVKSAGGEIQGGLLAIGAVLGVSACLALAVGVTSSQGKAG
jgi:ACS family tartrate transporter-like MFS transporter